MKMRLVRIHFCNYSFVSFCTQPFITALIGNNLALCLSVTLSLSLSVYRSVVCLSLSLSLRGFGVYIKAWPLPLSESLRCLLCVSSVSVSERSCSRKALVTFSRESTWIWPVTRTLWLLFTYWFHVWLLLSNYSEMNRKWGCLGEHGKAPES